MSSESDSDTSIEPEEVEEVEEVKEPKQSKKTKSKKKEVKRRELTLDEITQIENKIIQKTQEQDEPEPKPKRKPGQPKLTEQEKLERKLAKKTIIKEKVIYMIPDKEGGYKKVKNPTMSATALRRWKREQEKEEQEEKLGKQLCSKKNGGIDNRSKPKRTEAQIAATQRMVEANKKRRAAEKELKDEKKKNIIKQTVKESVKEVVAEPLLTAPPPPKPRKWNELIF